MPPLRPLALTLIVLSAAPPALAEPLTLARPSAAAINRAALLPTLAHAPRLPRAAETLAAEARAVPPPADGRRPEEMDYVDYYGGLDDPAVIGAALDVAAVQALEARSAWGWLTLSEIALDMALGDHDAQGQSTARPDAFAQEALNATAAGAAVTGFALAREAGEGVSALALMVRALEQGGDRTTATRVALMARRLFPDLEATGYDTDISALLRLSAAPPPLPEPPAEDPPSPTRRAGEWLMSCGPGRDCLIQSDLDGLSLEIARAAGPGAPVSVQVVLAGAGWRNGRTEAPAPPPQAALRIDARPLYPEAAQIAFRRHPSATEGWAFFTVPPVRLTAALDALFAGEKLTLTGQDGGATLRVDLGLFPLRDLAAEMDRLQGRAGTETALVLRGPALAAGAGLALPEGWQIALRPCPEPGRPEAVAALLAKGDQARAFAPPQGGGRFCAGPRPPLRPQARRCRARLRMIRRRLASWGI